jgi:type I restriction enzyme M protein
MVREALRERFLAALSLLGGSAGNQRLNTELGWQQDTYQQVRAALVKDAEKIVGKAT